jgi:hypothetical protein
MAIREFIKPQAELEEIAELMLAEARQNDGPVIYRVQSNHEDGVYFRQGKAVRYEQSKTQINKEDMGRRIYTGAGIDDIRPDNYRELTVTRDLFINRFNFHLKGKELPTEQITEYESMPAAITHFDAELQRFTMDFANARIRREFFVYQSIVVNSKGGVAIQSIPFFRIEYNHGYSPIPTYRDISAVCNTDDDIRRMTTFIQYLADPTLDKKISKASGFEQAFSELHKLTPLRFGTLQEAGIPLQQVYDVVMLTGVPVHEIFGHHFEEPIRYLDFGESATFKYDQDIQNTDIRLSDNPLQTVEGFRLLGFSHFDAYGRPRKEQVHIEDGKVKGFLGSEYADPENLKGYMNLERSDFVGSAVQHIDGQFPQPRMSNTVLDGKVSLVDLEGKIVVIPHEGHTVPQDKTYNVKSYESYIIRNGIPLRIIPLQVTGGINQALKDIQLLPEWSYQTGMCGKPEPIYYPQSAGHARVPVSQFARNQIWKNQQVYPLPIQDVHLRIL